MHPDCLIYGTIHRMEQRWALANFIRDQLRARGWSQRDLAAHAGIAQATISRLLNRTDIDFELTTLVQLSIVFEIPLWRLIALAGFPISVPDMTGLEDQQLRLAVLAATFPWVLPLVEEIANLTPDDRAGVMAYLDVIRMKHQRQRSGNQ